MADKYEVIIKDGQIVMTEEVTNLLKQARLLDETIKDLTKRRDEIIKAMKTAMDKNHIDLFESGIVRIARTSDSVKKEINVVKMKEDGIYDKYVFDLPTKGTLRVTYPKEKDNE